MSTNFKNVFLLFAICAFQSLAHAGADFPRCSDLFVTHKPSFAFSDTNRNGHIPLEEYGQTNDRTFSSYQNHFGSHFRERFPVKSWLDSGAGYGLATLDAVTSEYAKRAVAINAQDGLGPLRSENYDWFHKHAGVFKTGRLVGFVGTETIDAAMIDPEMGLWKPRAVEMLVHAGAKRLKELERAKRFQYLVGHSENVLPKIKSKFELITDPFGAYFYSATRPLLLREYYEKLESQGTALIIFRARDVIMWKYDRQTGHVESKISEYGPESIVLRKDGREQSLEDYLVETYPTVFSLTTVHTPEETKSIRPIALHRLLVMKRDSRYKSLPLDEFLAIEEIYFGESGFESQIPSATYREH